MKKTSNRIIYKYLAVLCISIMTTGCSIGPQKATDAMPHLKKSIENKNWKGAFLHYTHIFQTASKENIDSATMLVKKYPEVIQAGNLIFQPSELRREVIISNRISSALLIEANALCNLITAEECLEVRNNLKKAESLVVLNKPVRPPINITKNIFEKLSDKEKNKLEEKYSLIFFDNDTLGIITERQTKDVSRGGSTAGSEIGSSLASGIYINNAISSSSYNMWTDIAVGILGGVAGSGGNKEPVQQFTIYYAVRTLSNKSIIVEATQSQPIGEPVGACLNVLTRRTVEQELCSMTIDEIRKKYLIN